MDAGDRATQEQLPRAANTPTSSRGMGIKVAERETDMTRLKVSLVQLSSSSKVNNNLFDIERLLQQQLPDDAEVLVLPECFAGIGGSIAEQGEDSTLVRQWMSELAQKHQCWLVGGSVVVPQVEDGRSAAACFVYNPQGQEVARYDKIHLFDAEVSDSTGRYCESDDYVAGSEVVTVDIGKATLGLSICYDLRFPELYRQLVAENADILCIPSAFTRVTGDAHWEALLRGRAIENQCFVLAANQCGEHYGGRETYGHSAIISPWGDIVAVAGEEAVVISASLDLKKLKQIRQQMPCLEHRKL